MTTSETKKPEAEEEDFEALEVSDKAEEAEKTPAPADADDQDDDDDEDDRRISEQNDDESGDDSEEERRERRRVQKQQQRAKRKAFAERDKAMIAMLEQQNALMATRLEALEGRTLQRDAMEIDERINDAAEHYRYAERVMQDAVARGDGETVTKALRARDEAAMRVSELRDVRGRISSMPPQRMNTGPDPRVVSQARSWFDDNGWVDPSGRDEDSAIVLTIDQKLAEEGLDPTSPEYWDELSNRVRRRFPDKYRREGRRGPPVGGGREFAPAGRTQVRVTPERKQAMIDAGFWEDPEKRKRMLKQYAEYDKNSQTR